MYCIPAPGQVQNEFLHGTVTTLLKALDSPKLASHAVVAIRAFKRTSTLHFILREGSSLARHLRREYADDFRFLVSQAALAQRLPRDSPIRQLFLDVLRRLREAVQAAP